MDNQKNYTTSKNNPYHETDYTKQDISLNSAVKQNADNSQDEEVIKYKRSKKAYSRFLFAVESDAHLGGQGFDANRENLARNLVLSCWNSIYGVGGDMLDNANQLSATNIYGNRITPSNAVKVACLALSEVKDKVAFVIGGNHDAKWGNRNRDTNIAPSEIVAQTLGADYVPYGIVYSIPTLTPDTHQIKYMSGFILHSNVKANKFSVTDDSLKYVLKKCSDIGIDIDFIITEHLHTGSEGVYKVQVPVYDKFGKRIGDQVKSIYICNGKSFQNDDTIFAGSNLFSNKTNLKALFCSWSLNPYYTSNQILEPKYVPHITPFNVLKKNTDEPSNLMSALIKLYKRPNLKTYKDILENADICKVATHLKNADKNYKEQMDSFIQKSSKKQTKNVAEEIVKND